MRRQEGFTLIELLVVILIIGILAAIAVPSFLGQRDKANDTEAKQTALTMRKAVEAYRTEGADYGATVPDLVGIEPTLKTALDEARLQVVGVGDADSYAIGAIAKRTGHVFYFHRDAGTTLRLCQPIGEGGCGDDAGTYPGIGAAGRW